MSNSPAVGPVVEKVTRTRTLSAAEAAKDPASGNQMPELFEYLEILAGKADGWSDHIAYLYRDEPKATQYPGAPAAYIDKFAGTIEVRPGHSVPMDDAGNIQQAIKEKFGGRVFRMIVKRGRERITEGRFVNEAPPKYPDANLQQFAGPLPNASPNVPADANFVAAKAIDAMANQEPNAMRLAMEIMSSAANVIKQGTAPTNTNDFIDKTVIAEIIRKGLNPPAPPPPADPIELFIKMKDLFQPPATNSVQQTLDLIGALKNSGLFPGGGGRTSLLDLGREALPVLASAVKDTMHEYRLSAEANVRAMELQRGINPAAPIDVNPKPAAPPPPMDAAAPSTPQTAAPAAETSGMPSFQWIEQRIANIAKDLNYTVDEAVDETLSFLYNVDPRIVGLLLDPPKLDPRLKPGEEGLLQLFQFEPILQQVPVGPRLTEYIKKFVIQAKEAEAARLATAKQPTPPPSA